MNKSVFKLCLTAVVSFVAGIVLATLAFNIARWIKSNAKATRRNNQTINANDFFYSTMHAFFEGIYSSEDIQKIRVEARRQMLGGYWG